MEVAKPQLFDGMPSKVAGFVTGCKLYIRNKLVEATVEAQVQGRTLREVMVKIGLEKTDIQKAVMVEVLLDSGATGLVMSSEFAKKQGFKLKKLERPVNVKNVDGSFNKEGPIENTVEINIYY